MQSSVLPSIEEVRELSTFFHKINREGALYLELADLKKNKGI